MVLWVYVRFLWEVFYRRYERWSDGNIFFRLFDLKMWSKKVYLNTECYSEELIITTGYTFTLAHFRSPDRKEKLKRKRFFGFTKSLYRKRRHIYYGCRGTGAYLQEGRVGSLRFRLRPRTTNDLLSSRSGTMIPDPDPDGTRTNIDRKLYPRRCPLLTHFPKRQHPPKVVTLI